MKKSIILKDGGKPGKTLAVFAGIHGNEVVGIKTLDSIISKINISAGKVYFIYANPRAIKKNIRYIDSDLNRSFYGKVNKESYETKRAKELKKILNKCDALLDLHAFRSSGIPFIICEKDSYKLASKLDFSIISSGWDNFDIGSVDGYMRSQGKQVICLELGSIKKTKTYIPLAKKSILQFLKYYGVIDKNVQFSKNNKTFIKIYKRMFKSRDFAFTNSFSTGQLLPKRKIFAKDKTKKYISKNEYIFFPDDTSKIGSEVCLLAKITRNTLG